MVEYDLPKVGVRVRFSYTALRAGHYILLFYYAQIRGRIAPVLAFHCVMAGILT